MRRLAILFALLGLTCVVQVWSVQHAVVPAQDAVRYVAIAQSLERDGVRATLADHAEHPLFPGLVWLSHAGLSACSTSGDAGWAISSQVAAAAMLVATLVPLYFFLLRTVGNGPASIGAAFFCVLPAVARLGADGLSDSTQLFFIAAGLWSLGRYWPADGGPVRPAWLLLFGLCVGVGLLARPEAAVLLPTLAAATAWFQGRRDWRQPWRRLALGAVGAAVGLAAVMGPYLHATGALSPSAIAARVLGREQPAAVSAATLPAAAIPAPSPGTPGEGWGEGSSSAGRPLPPTPVSVATKGWRLSDGEAMAFGAKDNSISTRFRGYRGAVAEYLRELPEALHYWIGLLAVFGVWQSRRDPARPLDRFAQLLFVAHSLAAVHLAATLGYLSERHLLTLALLGVGPAGRGALDLGAWFAVKLSERGRETSSPSICKLQIGERGGWVVALLAAAACLPPTLAPLHESRQSHRLAGNWLARTAEAPGAVLDTRGWTGLYSGRPTYRYDAAKAAYRDPSLAYVVIVERELELDSGRSRTLRHLLGGAAQQVARFAAPRPSADTVLVYRWRPERFTQELKSGRKG